MSLQSLTDDQLISEYKTAFNLRSLQQGLNADKTQAYRQLDRRVSNAWDEISNRGLWPKVGKVGFDPRET